MADTIKASDSRALGISFQTVLDKNAQRTIVMQTHLALDAPDEEINALMDRVYRATDRQIAKYELVELKKQIEEDTKTLIRLRSDLDRIDERNRDNFYNQGKQGEFNPDKHLRPAERQERSNVLVGATKYEEAIRRNRERVKELEPMVNGHAVSSAADRHAG